MLLTINNMTAAPLLVPHPIGVTVPAFPGSVTLGMQITDLSFREDTGNPSWRVIQDMVKKGQITYAVAADPVDTNIVDDVNEV